MKRILEEKCCKKCIGKQLDEEWNRYNAEGIVLDYGDESGSDSDYNGDEEMLDELLNRVEELEDERDELLERIERLELFMNTMIRLAHEG